MDTLTIILLVLLFGLICFGGWKFMNVMTEFLMMMSESPGTRARKEHEQAVENNIKFYDRSYANMLELLKDTWYICGVKMVHGGIIKATYKKYPNVWMNINLSYDEYDDGNRTNLVEPEFYIDDTNLTKCTFGLYMMLSDNEEKRKASLESFNKLVDMNVENYCRENKIDLYEGKFFFNFTDKETNTKTNGSLDPITFKPAREKFYYNYTITDKVYTPGSFANPNDFTFSKPKIAMVSLNDKQMKILETIDKNLESPE